MVITGWLFDIEFLKRIYPGFVPMMFNTAICFLCLGLSILIFQSNRIFYRTHISIGLAIFVLIIGVLTMLQFLFEFDAGIDELFLEDRSDPVQTYAPGRMAFTSALGFIIVSIGLILISVGSNKGVLYSQLLSVGLIIYAFVPLLGYIYGVQEHYGYSVYTLMALHTVLLFLILGVGLLTAVPEAGIMSIVSSDSIGGYIARKLLPVSVLLPVLFIWILIVTERSDSLSIITDFHLIAVILIFLFVFLFWSFLSYVNFIDKSRTKAMEEVNIANQQIRNHIENSPLAMIEWDSNFRVSKWSAQARALFGWEEAEVKGKLPREMKIVFEEDKELTDSRMSQLLKGEIARDISINRNYTKDMKLLQCVWYNSALIDAEGSLISILSLIDDVTEDKVIESKLRQNEFLMRIAGNLANLGGWKADLADYSIIWSDQVAAIHEMPAGFSPTLEDGIRFYAPEYRDRITEVFNRCAREGISFDEEMQILTKTDRRVWVRNIGQAEVDSSGKVVSVIGGFQDISENKRVEGEVRKLNEELENRVEERTRQLAEINVELEAFSYTVSHDLRAPLRAIEGFASILTEDYSEMLDKNGKRVLNVIHENTLKMKELIDSLLSFSLINRKDLQFSEIDVNTLVKSLFYEITTREQQKRIKFETSVLCRVMGDPTLIKQVLINLISNAVKFTALADSPVIDISCSTKDGFCEFRIRDNGVGFEMTYADKLFRVFQRLHSEKDFKGTGAGLAIVERIVSRHGGSVRAEGKKGRGATFYFSLPACST